MVVRISARRHELVVVEEDLAWWQRMSLAISALVMAKDMYAMLAAIKTGVESQVSTAV